MSILVDEKDYKTIEIDGVKITLKPLTFGDTAKISSMIKDYAVPTGNGGQVQLTDEGLALYQKLLVLHSIVDWDLDEPITLDVIDRLNPAASQEILKHIYELSGIDQKN